MSGHEPKQVYSVEKKGHVKLDQELPSTGFLPQDSSREILDAISALREEVADLKTQVEMNSTHDNSAIKTASTLINQEPDMDLELRLEVAQMVRTIAKAKSELAQIKHPGADDDHFGDASSELDAIVMATESATNNILEATETIEKDLTQIAALAHDDQDIVTLSDKIAAQTTSIMEACNFQDITGQRITKVVTTMQFIEEKIRTMIDIWGFEAFSELPVPITEKSDEDDPDADLLGGPQMEGQGISQAEIDALFD